MLLLIVWNAQNKNSNLRYLLLSNSTQLYSWCIFSPVFDVTSHVTLMMTGAKVGLSYHSELISTFKLEHKTRLCQKCQKIPQAILKLTVFCLPCFVIFLMYESSDFCSPGVCMKALRPFPSSVLRPSLFLCCVFSVRVSPISAAAIYGHIILAR